MKKKSFSESREPTPPPQNVEQWPKEPKEIPTFLKKLKGKTPIEALATINPRFADDQRAQEGTAALMAGIGVDLLVPIPEWAKAASKKFWEACGIAIPGMDNWQAKDLGKMIGLWEVSKKSAAPNLEKPVNQFCEYLKTDAANATAETSKQFFDGRADAGTIIGKLRFSPQRAKIYIVIAIAWREVEKFESAGQLHRWLLGQKVILPATDPAETRKVCRAIGLQFKSKAGRPRKKNPVTN